MSKEKTETTLERLARMKSAKAEASEKGITDNSLVDQLTHEDSGEPDFTAIAQKLRERQEQESNGENDAYTKMTIYIRDDIVQAFDALATKRGQKKEYANQAFQDFIQKKIRELDIQ